MTHLLRVFNDVMDTLDPQERALLRARFCDPLMQKFVSLQVDAAQRQLTDLNPATFSTDRAVDFLQAAKEARSVWQFWVEFRDYVRDWAKSL